MNSSNLITRSADRLFLSIIHIVEGVDSSDMPRHVLNFSVLSVGIDLAEEVLVEETDKIGVLGRVCIARLRTSMDLRKVTTFEVLDLIFILALIGASEEDLFDFEEIMARVGLSRAWADRLSAVCPLPNRSFRVGELMEVIERKNI